MALGLVVRLAAVLGRRHHPAAGDALYYHLEALSLVGGHGWVDPLVHGGPGRPSAAFPPLFTVLLTVPPLLGARSFLAGRIWCAVLGAGAVPLAAVVGRRLAGPRAGLIAAGLAAVYPNLWMDDDLAMSEALSPLLALGVLWAAYAMIDRPTPRRAALLGGLVGLAALGRDEMALLGLLLVVPACLGRRRPWRRRLRLLAAGAGAAVVVVAPWIGYDLGRFHDPVLISDGLGVTLASANCDPTWYGPASGYWSMACALDVPYRPGVDESVQGAEAQAAALRYVDAHLAGLPRVELLRLGRAAGLYRPLQQIDLDAFIEGRPRRWALVGLAGWYVLAAASVAGGRALRRRGTPIWPLLAIGADVAASVLLAFGQTRYRSTFEVCVVLLGAVALDAAWPRRPPPVAPDLGAAGARGALPADEVLVVVPALNEEGAVAAVVYQVADALPGATVLVVDDGSTDATGVLAAAAGARVATVPFTLGVGGAMRVGFRYAHQHGFRAVVQLDGDGQHDPRDLPGLLAALGDDPRPRVVVGSRFAGGGAPATSWARRCAMRALAGHLTRRTGVHLDDVTSGYRAHSRGAIELFARRYPGDYLSDTVESLVIAHEAGASIAQVPVRMRARSGGTPSQGVARSAVYLGRVALILLLAALRRSSHHEEVTWTAST